MTMTTYGASRCDDEIERAMDADADASRTTAVGTRRSRVGAAIAFAGVLVLGAAAVTRGGYARASTLGSGEIEPMTATTTATAGVTPSLGASTVREALNEALDHLSCVQKCAELKDAMSVKIEADSAALTCADFEAFSKSDSCVATNCGCEDATVIDETIKYLCDEGGAPDSVGKDAFHTRTEDAVISACAST